MDLDVLREAVHPPEMRPQQLGTALIALETTHNGAGGTVLPLGHMAGVRRIAEQNGVPVHLDGARLFNAAIALNVEPREIACHADSVTFCISKGLSAPVGSVLTGTNGFITRARGFRRMLGGTMRQAGLLAACGIVALERMVDRLIEDHWNAQALARGLQAIDPALVDPVGVETNIVMVTIPAPGLTMQTWVERLRAHGVLAAAAKPNVIRLVTHRHVSQAEVERAIAAFAAVRSTCTSNSTAA
jgi:threonine aldolase